jgi:hypothetical protein
MKINLTADEKIIVENVLEKVIDNLQYDSEDNVYRESYEDWLLSLDTEDFKILKNAWNKIKS